VVRGVQATASHAWPLDSHGTCVVVWPQDRAGSPGPDGQLRLAGAVQYSSDVSDAHVERAQQTVARQEAQGRQASQHAQAGVHRELEPENHK